MHWPARYFSGLSLAMKVRRQKELLKRRVTPYSKLRMGATDAGGTRRRSRWTMLFHKTYPELKFNKNAITRRTGISRSTLNTVYDRGLKAWKTSGSRVGASAHQWAISRTYKYILITKKKAPISWYKGRYDPDNYLRKQ
jgi:hypothetical protein